MCAGRDGRAGGVRAWQKRGRARSATAAGDGWKRGWRWAGIQATNAVQGQVQGQGGAGQVNRQGGRASVV